MVLCKSTIKLMKLFRTDNFVIILGLFYLKFIKVLKINVFIASMSKLFSFDYNFKFLKPTIAKYIVNKSKRTSLTCN